MKNHELSVLQSKMIDGLKRLANIEHLSFDKIDITGSDIDIECKSENDCKKWLKFVKKFTKNQTIERYSSDGFILFAEII